MKYVFELFAFAGVTEHHVRQFATLELPGRIKHFAAKRTLDLSQGGLPRLSKRSREIVGIQNGDAPFMENFGTGGFAHANAAGEAECFHLAWDLNCRLKRRAGITATVGRRDKTAGYGLRRWYP